jgi:hypothetical protein
MHAMHDVAPDTKVKVRVLRAGKPRDFVVTARPGMGFFAMHEPPGAPGFGMRGPPFGAPMLIRGPLADMELATLTPQLGRYFGTDKGVLVVRAPREEGFKLEDGDVILSIDGREPTSGSHATRILASYQPGEKVTMRLMREHKTVSIEATLPDNPHPEHGPHLQMKEDTPT